MPNNQFLFVAYDNANHTVNTRCFLCLLYGMHRKDHIWYTMLFLLMKLHSTTISIKNFLPEPTNHSGAT